MQPPTSLVTTQHMTDYPPRLTVSFYLPVTPGPVPVKLPAGPAHILSIFLLLPEPFESQVAEPRTSERPPTLKEEFAFL